MPDQELRELRTIADTIEVNGGWRIAAIKVRGAADDLVRLLDRITDLEIANGMKAQELERLRVTVKRLEAQAEQAEALA